MILNLDELMIINEGTKKNIYQKEPKSIHEISEFKDIPELLLQIDAERIIDIIPQLIQLGMVNNSSEFIQLTRQDDIKINNEKIFEDELDRVLMNDEILQIGTKRLLRIIK